MTFDETMRVRKKAKPTKKSWSGKRTRSRAALWGMRVNGDKTKKPAPKVTCMHYNSRRSIAEFTLSLYFQDPSSALTPSVLRELYFSHWHNVNNIIIQCPRLHVYEWISHSDNLNGVWSLVSSAANSNRCAISIWLDKYFINFFSRRQMLRISRMWDLTLVCEITEETKGQ